MIAPVVVAIALTQPQPGLAERIHAAHTRPRPPFRVRRARHRRHLRARVVHIAASLIGTPYVWGGARPGGFDCSGLVQYVYGRIGLLLPRTTWTQRTLGIPIRGALHRGDLVFAYGDSHVAIYAGHGTVIVAPRAGSVVKREPLSWLPVSHIRRLIHRG